MPDFNLPSQPPPSYFQLRDGRNVVLFGAAMAHAGSYARTCVRLALAEQAQADALTMSALQAAQREIRALSAACGKGVMTDEVLGVISAALAACSGGL